MGGFFGLAILGDFVFRQRFGLHCTLGQGELVGCCSGSLSLFDFGLNFAGRFAVGAADLGLRCSAGQFAAELIEIAALGHDGFAGFGRRSGVGLGGIGNIEHRTCLDAVDVAVYKRIGVGT